MWMEQEEEESGPRGAEARGELGFHAFNAMLDDDWGFTFSSNPSPAETFLLHPSANSSSSGSPPLTLNPNPSSSSFQPLLPHQIRDNSLSTSIFSPNRLEEFLQNPSLSINSVYPSGEFFTRTKVLQPLDASPAIGAPPTLFQKRAAALRQSSENGEEEEEQEGEDGKEKIKKKNMPAKNLMAERRRRKKLNDRLFMLRSVVPKISKMDRASILGDAIEYLKELIQKINELQEEFSGAQSPSLSPLSGGAAGFHPLTPTLPSLPHHIKEELFPSPLQSPNSQLPKVEVREKEGKAVNIHMFCTRRPGILLSTMKALDNLGLDVQQAVISCFNGFALDIFQAEPCNGNPRVRADEIKAVLLHSIKCLGFT